MPDASTQTAASETFRIALIGVGGIATAHLGAADQLGDVIVAAAVDSSPQALEKLAGKTETFSSVGAMLDADVKLDGAVVCTPPQARADVLKPLFDRNIPVLCEKPLARTADEARKLAEAGNDRSAVGYCHRFTPAILEMKRRLAAGELGKPVRFENTFASWHPTMKDRWMSDEPVSGGGSFIDTGCHSLDLFRFLLGDGRVEAAAFNRAWTGRGESNATVLLAADASGAAGVIASGWQEPERFTVTLVGTEALLSYDYMKPTELLFQPSHSGPGRTLEVESHEVRFARQLDAFRRVARDGHRGDLCDLAEAVKVNELVDAAYKRSRT